MEYVSPRGRDAARKAVSFATYCKEHGWAGKWSKDETTGVTHLFARRGDNETIDVWWQENGIVISGAEPVYTLAGERIKVRNLSAAAKIVASTPDPKRLGKAARKRKRHSGIDATGETSTGISVDGLQASSLPFDSESDDDEIEAVLHKRSISWINRFSGQVFSAFVNANSAHFHVVRMSDGRDQVHFCDPASGGFQAVYLNSIVAVG